MKALLKNLLHNVLHDFWSLIGSLDFIDVF